MNSLFVEWVLARLKEPSSWAGLTGLISTLGVAVSPAQAGAIIQFGVAFASLVLVFMPEPGNKK